MCKLSSASNRPTLFGERGCFSDLLHRKHEEAISSSGNRVFIKFNAYLDGSTAVMDRKSITSSCDD